MTIYIAGPITGIENYNHEAFEEAEELLTKIGYTVVNPRMLPTTLDPKAYMPICLEMIKWCDAIFLLEGWENSDGAKQELLFALDNGYEIFVSPFSKE